MLTRYAYPSLFGVADIDTPLTRFVGAHAALRTHCARVHAAVQHVE